MSYPSYERYAESLSARELEQELAWSERRDPEHPMTEALRAERESRSQS